MIRIMTTAAVAAVLATGAFAKSHDQGVADGKPTPQPTTGAFIQSLGGNGVSGGVKNGQRGADASEKKGDNRTTPVVND